jgi:methylmalonyl-CoA/ethylmalonyl-CoA epimerase
VLKRIMHVAVAVGNLDRACEFWRDVMGAEIEGRTPVPGQNVEVAFVRLDGDTRLELLSSTDDDSPVARFLAKHGPGLHHICFAVDNLATHLKHLAEHGVRLVDREPRPGAEGDLIAFLHPSSTLGTLIELSERRSHTG